MRCSRIATLAASLAIACGGSGGAPYPAGSWTWVDVAGTACSDGSPTGFAVNPGDQPDVVFFMMGGGACWDDQTCSAIAPMATPGPFQSAQFALLRAALVGTFLDRATPGNPFVHWTYVFVPYCTGDLHAGDSVVSYATRTWYHRGRVNVAADVARLAPGFPGTRRLLIAGSSAGGYGALLQYDTIRAAWLAQSTYLLDDAGPPLEGDALAPALRTAWRARWNLDPLLAQLCPASPCQDDFSLIVPQLAGRHPRDRMALLSSAQDVTMRGYFQLTADQFQAALLQTVQDRIAASPNFHAFLVSGQDHALLANAAAYAAGGVPLPTWLEQLVDDDPAWRSLGP